MKNNVIKKFVFPTLVFIYDIVSLFWCYIFVKSLIFKFSTISLKTNGIDIIGGADIPTIMFMIGNVYWWMFFILFFIFNLGTVFLLTFSILKKINRKSNILLFIFSSLSLIVFMLIPTQTYVVFLYAISSRLPFILQLFPYILKVYIVLSNIISLVIIVKNILFAINRRRKTL